MAVRPELVDFSQVKEDESNLIGIAGRHPVRESSEAFGNEILEYTMKTLIIAAIPIVFAIVYYMLCILSQYIDYRKRRLPKEKYSEFCKRVYTRYL